MNIYCQGSQTEISARSVCVQTEVHIPTAIVMDPCPADFSDPYPEVDVTVDLQAPSVSSINHKANVPQYENTTAHRFFFITQSDITIFYYIFNFIKKFLKSSFLTFQNGRFLHVRLQTHYFSFSFMIFHFIRILHVQINFLLSRLHPP